MRGLDLGVEFTGGRLLEFSTSQPVAVDRRPAGRGRRRLPERGGAGVRRQDGDENITVRTGQISNDEAVEVADALAPVGGEVTKQRDELIGPTLGQELRTKALVAFAIAIGAQMLYLAFRFRWTYAAAAVALDVARRAHRGRHLRVARQAGRRGVPRGGAVDHRPGGQRHRS